MRNSNSLMVNIGGRGNDIGPHKNQSAMPTNRSTRLSGQKKRALKDGFVEKTTVEDLPSDISDDEWGEIQKFGQKLYEEQLKKQKVDHENRQKQVREVLDQQVKLRAELREKNQKERQDFDKKILDKAKQDLEVERKQKADLQVKAAEQKRMREIMIKESK